MGIAVIHGSSRKNGNTDQLARLLVEGYEADHIYLTDYRIDPIVDYRHSEKRPYPDDDYRAVLERVLAQDVLVFTTPIYWYGPSGLTKTFIDRWSQSLRENKETFLAALAAKSAWVLAVGDDEPHLKGIPLIQQFQYIFEYTGTVYAGYIIGKGNKPGDIVQDTVALAAVDAVRQQWRLKSRTLT